jgi:carboxypeptidase family protein
MATTKVLFSILLIWSLSLPLSAQVSSGEIVGTITDTSGAAVPNAKIVTTNAQTNTIVRETAVSNDGTYAVTLLPPGTYNLSAEASGFRKTRQRRC